MPFKRKFPRRTRKGTFKRRKTRRTFKRGKRTFKRRFLKGRRHTKGKAMKYSVTKYPPEMKPRDHAIRKLQTSHYLAGERVLGLNGGTSTPPGTLNSTTPSDYWYFSMNNCYSPGVQNVAFQSFVFPISDGFNAMTRIYNLWLVRSAKIEIELRPTEHVNTLTLVGGTPRIIMALCPMNSRNNATAGSLTWDQWQLQPGFKQVEVTDDAAANRLCRLKQYCSVDKTEGYNRETTKFLSTAGAAWNGSCLDSAGSPVIIVPTQLPTWWFMVFTPDSAMFLTDSARMFRYSLSVKMTFYTEWFNRKMASYSIPG